MQVRTCHGPGGAGGCGGWQDQAVGPGVPLALAVGRRRYLQVELVLGTSDTLVAPQVDEVTLVYTPNVGAARVTKYYYHGGQRVAMRTPDGVYYLHGDHLGSTSLVTTGEDRWVGIVEVPAGSVWARQLYHPFGTVRYAGGTLPTDFGFTGQRKVAGTGLMYYKARYYHPGLGRFVSADAIVPNPGAPSDLNRYAYVRNNPLRYTDPTGHCAEDPSADPECWAVYSGVADVLSENIPMPTDLWRWPIKQLQGLQTWLNRGIVFTGIWSSANLADAVTALDRVHRALGHYVKGTMAAFGISGEKTLTLEGIPGESPGGLTYARSALIELWLPPQGDDDFTVEIIIHELGHIVDWQSGPRGAQVRWSDASPEWTAATGWLHHHEHGFWYPYNVERWRKAPTPYARENPGEDFAESFTWYVENRNPGSGGFSKAPGDISVERQNALAVALGRYQFMWGPR